MRVRNRTEEQDIRNLMDQYPYWFDRRREARAVLGQLIGRQSILDEFISTGVCPFVAMQLPRRVA